MQNNITSKPYAEIKSQFRKQHGQFNRAFADFLDGFAAAAKIERTSAAIAFEAHARRHYLMNTERFQLILGGFNSGADIGAQYFHQNRRTNA